MTQAANFKYGKNNLASLIIISFAFTIVGNYRLEKIEIEFSQFIAKFLVA